MDDDPDAFEASHKFCRAPATQKQDDVWKLEAPEDFQKHSDLSHQEKTIY